jgi:hypothetical protein
MAHHHLEQKQSRCELSKVIDVGFFLRKKPDQSWSLALKVALLPL